MLEAPGTMGSLSSSSFPSPTYLSETESGTSIRDTDSDLFLPFFWPFSLLWLVAWRPSGSSRDSFKPCWYVSILHAPLALVVLCKLPGHLPFVASYSGSIATCGIYLLHASGNRNPRGPYAPLNQATPWCPALWCSFSCTGGRSTSLVASDCLNICWLKEKCTV